MTASPPTATATDVTAASGQRRSARRAGAAGIASVVLDHPGQRRWLIVFAGALLLLAVFVVSVGRLLIGGVGVWGNNNAVVWGFDIINYDWWIGIANAGTMLSALLVLLRQSGRGAVNRLAEAVTLLAAVCAAIYPVLHLGRPTYFYWNLVYPNTMALWPQFRSPLIWDATTILMYLVVSFLFWYVGMIPDLATLRDRAATSFKRKAYGVFALGWRGASGHWRLLGQTRTVLAFGLVPLVVVMQGGVALLFAASAEPGWHSTLMPPFFLSGALFSGFGLITVIAVALRQIFRLQDIITERQVDVLAKVLLAAGLVTAYGYAMEFFMAWYGGEPFELAVMLERLGGVYAWSFWAMVACNVVLIQPLWFARVRRSPTALITIGVTVAFGMWLERFMLIVITLYRDYLPTSGRFYAPTVWDFTLGFGSVGLFLTIFLLFVRYLPIVSMAETRADSRRAKSRRAAAGASA